mmetsp:Transcript_90635/g.157068  ORF Transcript_90635/g.157068 Transcript_90635/m.157068 type:complete len:200 (-) Transcript_90635:420-1019(-)
MKNVPPAPRSPGNRPMTLDGASVATYLSSQIRQAMTSMPFRAEVRASSGQCRASEAEAPTTPFMPFTPRASTQASTSRRTDSCCPACLYLTPATRPPSAESATSSTRVWPRTVTSPAAVTCLARGLMRVWATVPPLSHRTSKDVWWARQKKYRSSMATAAETSSGGLKSPTSSVGRMKSSTSRFVSPMRMKRSWAVMRS